MRRARVLIVGSIATGLLSATVAAPAQAAPCGVTDGPSLTTALANVACDPINLAPGTYTQPVGFGVNRTVSIVGAGAGTTTITRTGAGGVFNVTGGSPAISGVTITGATDGAGLVVVGGGAATLSNAVITGNINDSTNGAGISFSGTSLTVTDSVISNNTENNNSGGGGSNNFGGTATFNRVLFSGNHSTGAGGGGGWNSHVTGNTTNLTNVTFAGNTANGEGGAIRNGSNATMHLNNVTVAGNVADDDNGIVAGDGGGIVNSGGTFTLLNSIVANNTDRSGQANDCASAAMGAEITRLGFELVRDIVGCLFGGAGDTTMGQVPAGSDPKLQPLASNGGFSQTMALGIGGIGVNLGSPATPGSGGTACDAVDQRNQPRDQANTADCDLGAFEVQPVTGCSNVSIAAASGQPAPGTLSCTGDRPLAYSIVSGPSSGQVSALDAAAGTLLYTSNPGFSGTDSFGYKGTNAVSTLGSTGTVTVAVTPVPAAAATPATATATKKCKKKKKKRAAAAKKKCRKKKR